jgi:hypothetical protein
MARYSWAYSRLLGRIKEVQSLQKLAADLARRRPERGDAERIGALCRAGIVLLAGHIQGYIEDMSDTILDSIGKNRAKKELFDKRILYYLSQDIIRDIRAHGENVDRVTERIRLLWQRDGDVWSTDAHFVAPLSTERFKHGFGSPTLHEIRRYIGRFGYSQYKSDLQRYLGARSTAVLNMVDNVVEQRTKIAHGDFVVTATPTDLADMVALVQEFCRGTDKVVGDWCKARRCPIRGRNIYGV